MVLKMEEKELIRKLVIVQGLSQREVNRRFGCSRDVDLVFLLRTWMAWA